MPSAMCVKVRLLRFMTQKVRTPLGAAICVFLVYGITYFGAGLWVDYAHQGENFISIFDPAEIWWGSFLWLFVSPIWWAYFVWQPIGISKAIDSLHQNDVIFNPGEIKDPVSTTPKPATENRDLSSRVSSALRRSLWLILALLTTSVVILLHEVFLLPRSPLEKPTFWFVDLRTRFLLHVLTGLDAYVLASLGLRTLATVFELRAFFRNRNSITAIHPLHPDKCGGSGALGTFATRLGGLGVIIGFWAVFLTCYPMIVGRPSQLNLAIVMIYVVYIVVTLICLITPIWSAHKAMERFRDSKLSTISHELEELVTSSMGRLGTMIQAPDAKPLQADVDKMGYLRQMYQFILSTTPVWPISVPTIKAFATTASLPLVSALLPFVIDTVGHLVSR